MGISATLRLAQGGYRGEGFGTERARLAQDGYRGQGFGTERARLAQGGFLGQFYKRNPFKRNL